MKPKILMFGPIPPPYGGMSVYIKNIIESKLIYIVDLKILNTRVPAFFFKHKEFRIILFIKFLIVYLSNVFIYSFQIIHIHTSANLGFWEKGFFVLISKLLQKKVILHIHGSEFKEFCENSRLKQLIAFILKHSNAVIVLSDIWAKFIYQYSGQKNIITIENGINLEPFYKCESSKDSIKILFVGALGRRKGLFTILESIKNFPELQVPRIKFYIIGKGLSEKEHLEVLNAFKKEKLPNVVFLGELSGEPKYEFYRKSDIFILPSFAEGFPIALLEAMASYLPIVSTKVGGIPDMIHEENGILITPGNYKDLGIAIIKLINSEDLRVVTGSNNRKRVEKYYNLDQMIEKISKLYFKLLHK